MTAIITKIFCNVFQDLQENSGLIAAVHKLSANLKEIPKFLAPEA
jgi:hypothetical protein